MPLLSQRLVQYDQALSYWMIVVAALRFLSVVLGYLFPGKLLEEVFGKLQAPKEKEDNPSKELRRGFSGRTVRALLGRTFAVWTTITCLLCLLVAFNLDSEPVVLVTIASFVVALIFFLMELLIFGTMNVGNIVSPGIVATSSTVWLLIHYQYRFLH